MDGQAYCRQFRGQSYGARIRCANPNCQSHRCLQDKGVRLFVDDFDFVGQAAEKNWFAAKFCIDTSFFNQRTNKWELYEKRFYCGPMCHLQTYTGDLVAKNTQQNLWKNYQSWFQTHPQAKRWYKAFEVEFCERFKGFSAPSESQLKTSPLKEWGAQSDED